MQQGVILKNGGRDETRRRSAQPGYSEAYAVTVTF